MIQIASLGPALTSDDDRVRMRGVLLFAEVRKCIGADIAVAAADVGSKQQLSL